MSNINNETNNECPYCGNPMKRGFVQSSHQIYFNEGKRRFFASGDLRSRNISRFDIIKAPSVKAAYCANCKKIILDLE